MVSTYARIKPSHLTAGVNVSYFGQHRPPKNGNTSAKNARDQLLIGMNIFSNECIATPSDPDEQDHWIFMDFYPFSKDEKILAAFLEIYQNFYPWKKDKNPMILFVGIARSRNTFIAECIHSYQKLISRALRRCFCFLWMPILPEIRHIYTSRNGRGFDSGVCTYHMYSIDDNFDNTIVSCLSGFAPKMFQISLSFSRLP